MRSQSGHIAQKMQTSKKEKRTRTKKGARDHQYNTVAPLLDPYYFARKNKKTPPPLLIKKQ